MLELMRRDPAMPRAIRDLMDFVGQPMFETDALPEGNLAIDVSECNGEVIVRASMPGFDKDDIDIQIHNGVLSIKGEHREDKETKDERFYRRERRVGSVARRIALPGIISDAAAKAELKGGILTLSIPQAEVARPKQIPVG